MHDMTRDELQDLLPDLLHGHLSAVDAEAVGRLVALDPELSAELALLRTVNAAHRRGAAIDISRIVSALPVVPVSISERMVDDLAARRVAKRRPWISNRFARAAALLVVVGGGTMVSVLSDRDGSPSELPTTVSAESTARASSVIQLGLGASTDELSVEQLRALEGEIQLLDGIPSADPDAAPELLPVEGA